MGIGVVEGVGETVGVGNGEAEGVGVGEELGLEEGEGSGPGFCLYCAVAVKGFVIETLIWLFVPCWTPSISQCSKL